MLDTPIHEFFSFDLKKQPFGSGPWLCLNPVCEQYGKPVIKTVEIVRAGNRAYRKGIFQCDYCDLAYRRKFGDANMNFLRRTDIVTYGQLWEDTFRTFWNDITISIERMVNIFDMNSTGIYEEAKRLGLGKRSQCIDTRTVSLVKEYCPKDLTVTGANFAEVCKLAWLEILRIHATSSEGNLNILRFDGLRRWLEANENEWYKTHKVQKRIHRLPKTQEGWDQLDKFLWERVFETAEDMVANTDPFVQVTETGIVDRMGYRRAIRDKIEFLPQTQQALEDVVEDLIKYAVRRIWQTAEIRSSHRLPLTRNKLIASTRILNQELLEHAEVQRALDEALKHFSQ